MKNSRAIKFLYERGARVVSILSSTNYYVLQRVQSGTEIPCRGETCMLSTVINKQLIDVYWKYVDLLFYNIKISNAVGSFIVREEKQLDRWYPLREIRKRTTRNWHPTTKIFSFKLILDIQTVFCESYLCNWLIQTVFCWTNFCNLGPKQQN